MPRLPLPKTVFGENLVGLGAQQAAPLRKLLWDLMPETISGKHQRRRGAWVHGLLAAAALALICPAAKAQTGKIVFAGPPVLLSCQPVLSAPCFRIQFNMVDSMGAPFTVALPPSPQLAQDISVNIEGQTVTPFFAVASSVAGAQSPARATLVLVDISGSMNNRLANGETRFDAAKAALMRFLEGFQPGVDRVAIVPFESHHVAQTIEAAQFVTTLADAQREVNNLSVPRPQNNTALYSAVDLGLGVLKDQLRNLPASTKASLDVLTDGQNDVDPKRGDDAGLLAKSEGLEKVASDVHSSPDIQVRAVGFGSSSEVDETALKLISSKFQMATSAEALTEALTSLRAPSSGNSIQAAFLSPWPDRGSLAGRTFHVIATLQLPSGERLASNETVWLSPEMGVPIYSGVIEPREADALLSHVKEAPGGGPLSILRPILVFIGLGVIVLVLWLWIPRLVWREQADTVAPQPKKAARWAATAQTPMPQGVQARAPRSKNLPAGFETAKGIPAERAPDDATRVLPANMMSTRTRLALRQPLTDDRKKK
ncbi:MAG: vWA domain-containing protein [Terriglobia bacterium]